VKSIGVTDLRQRTAELLDELHGSDEPFVILQRSKKAAYLVSRYGEAPPAAEEVGWLAVDPQGPEGRDERLAPGHNASRLGWADGDWLYLLPAAAFREVMHFLAGSDQVLGATEEALHRDLDDLGWVEVKQTPEGTRRTVAVLLEGKQQRVLKLRRRALDLEVEA